MNLKTTLYLLIAALVLGGLLFLKRDDIVETRPTEDPKLLDGFEQNFHITRFEILHSRSREQTTFTLRDGDWWLTDPVVDRALPENIGQLIEVMSGNGREAIESNPSREQLEKLLLEPPRGRVSVFSDDGRSLRLRVGDREPSGHFCYIQIEGDKTLYRTGANLLNVIERPRQEWRDRSFIVGDGAYARRLELIHPGQPKIVLERTGIDWIMVEPTQFPADNSLANQLVHGLLRLRIRNFVASDPNDEQRREHRLDDAQATIVRLDLGQGLMEMRFGLAASEGEESRRSATESVRGHIVHVVGDVLPLLKSVEKDLRDRVVARIAINSTKRVELTGPSGEVRFEMVYDDAESRFRLVAPFERPIDDTRNGQLRYWFLDLKELKAIQSQGGYGFIDSNDVGGDGVAAIFDPPYSVLELDVVTPGQSIHRVRIEFAEPDGDTTLVRRADEYPDLAYVVPTDVVEKVIGADARSFLVRKVFPTDLLKMERFTATLGDRVMRIERKDGGATGGGRDWIDPDDPDRYSGDIQPYLTKVIGEEATSFRPRDPIPEDGFETPLARLVIEMTDASYYDGRFEMVIGHRDPTGTTVSAWCSELGRRIVFSLPIVVLEELEKVFQEAGR